MAREDLAVVEAALGAFSRGDMDAVLELVAADVVVTQPPEMPDRRTFHGHRGMAEVMTRWPGEWENYAIEVARTEGVGDHVVTTVRERGRGRDSGVDLEAEFTYVITVEGGKIARLDMFSREADALEAAGEPDR